MERKSFLIVSKEVLADKRLCATAKLLYAQLCDHQNKRTGQCNPRQTKLAEILGIPPRTVERCIATLRREGFIKIIRGQKGCSYEIPTRQTGGFETAKVAGGTRQSGGWEAPASLYEPYLKNLRGVAATSPNKKSSNTPAPPARKSAQSETLEAYYREERRKAGKA